MSVGEIPLVGCYVATLAKERADDMLDVVEWAEKHISQKGEVVLCDTCETCAHCLKNGCIPLIKEPATIPSAKLQQEVRKRLSVGATIRNAFGQGEELTNATICERTGQDLKTVSAWVAHLRKIGFLDRVEGTTIPVVHRLSGHIHVRVNKAAQSDGENIVRQARKTQPKWVFSLGAKESA